MHINRQVASALDALSHWPRFHLRLFAEGALVGIVSGVIISFFRWARDAGTRMREYMYEAVLLPGGWLENGLWFALLLGAAYMLWRFSTYEPNAGGSGIPQVKGVILGVIRLRWLRILWVKLVGGIVGIGLGLSLGREGPSIQIGAVTAQGISRNLGRFRIEERYLLTAGASAGLAAAFNAPLAGVMFALEELHRNFSGVVLAPAMAAALLATMVSRLAFGRAPIFEFGTVPVLPLQYIWIAVVVGIAAGLAGIVFNKGLLNIPRFYSLPCFRGYGKFAFALAAAGVLGYVFPQVLGGGNELINSLHTLPLSLSLFAALLIGKFLFTLVSYGCGAPGGFFLPMLVLGALTGSVVGIVLILVEYRHPVDGGVFLGLRPVSRYGHDPHHGNDGFVRAFARLVHGIPRSSCRRTGLRRPADLRSAAAADFGGSPAGDPGVGAAPSAGADRGQRQRRRREIRGAHCLAQPRRPRRY